MSEEREAKVEVKVGAYTADGTFLGEVVRFTAEEAGSWTNYSAATSGDDRGTTYTLYKLPGEPRRYRVHEFDWSNWQGEESEAFLHPATGVVTDEGPQYSAYTLEEARKEWRQLFAALGKPNVRDID